MTEMSDLCYLRKPQIYAAGMTSNVYWSRVMPVKLSLKFFCDTSLS